MRAEGAPRRARLIRCHLGEQRAGDASQVIGREPDRRRDTLVASGDSLERRVEDLGWSRVGWRAVALG
ncbi:hypothetical protein NDU88_002486 [Pleurodeles waltl]|uniref:Uncharacterized protein n=1 Tax=Pleurodeles waltl TaxID=8319 RepID=A0AAV7LFU3_PLEWA|nr:hypothetical protein NDU88_002486 [Pleurodeles waltl]